MFIKKKITKGRTYYLLAESYKEEGRVKQRILKYLGKEIPVEYRHLLVKDNKLRSRIQKIDEKLPEYFKRLKSLPEEALRKYELNRLIQFAHHSTAIEGNTLSLQETKLILEDGISPKGKDLEEIYDIKNTREAYEMVEKSAAEKRGLDLDFILKIHSLVLKDIDLQNAGQLRKVQVIITGTNYVPPPPVVVEFEMKEFIRWYETESRVLHPIILAALAHLRFELIHPFVDGNGRVGRLLMNYILLRFGYPITVLKVEDRDNYYDSLEKGRDNEMVFAEYILENMEKTVGEVLTF